MQEGRAERSPRGYPQRGGPAQSCLNSAEIAEKFVLFEDGRGWRPATRLKAKSGRKNYFPSEENGKYRGNERQKRRGRDGRSHLSAGCCPSGTAGGFEWSQTSPVVGGHWSRCPQPRCRCWCLAETEGPPSCILWLCSCWCGASVWARGGDTAVLISGCSVGICPSAQHVAPVAPGFLLQAET